MTCNNYQWVQSGQTRTNKRTPDLTQSLPDLREVIAKGSPHVECAGVDWCKRLHPLDNGHQSGGSYSREDSSSSKYFFNRSSSSAK